MCSQRGGSKGTNTHSKAQLLRQRIFRLLGLENIVSPQPVASNVLFRSPPRVPTISVHLSSAAPTPDSISTDLDLSGPEASSLSDSWVTVGGRRSLVACKIQALVEAFANRAQSVKARIAQPPTPSPTPPPDPEDQPEGRPRLESLINPGEEALEQSQTDPGQYYRLGPIRIPVPPRAWEPQCSFYLCWLFLVVLAYLYNSWFIFLRAVFPYQTPEMLPLFLTADYICDFVYLIDLVVIKVRIKYLDHGVWVEDISKTRKNYFKKRIFKMDVLSLLPLDFFYFLCGVNPLLRLPRLLKIQTFWEFFRRIDAIAKTPFIIRIIHTLLYMMFLIHANSCAYYAMSTWEGIGTNGWVFQGEGNAYIRCFYFATKTATSIGRNPKPENEYEYVFMTFSWLMGVFVFAFLIGQIRDIVATATQSKNQYRQLMDQSVRYLRNLDLPEDLQRRVRLWLNHTWEQQKTFHEATILDSLPIKMKTDVAISVHYNTLAKVQIFKDCDRSFLRDLVHKIRPVLFLAGDHICRKGEIGTEMYIVNSGQVLVMGGEKGEQVLATLTEGSVFGEISLLGLEGFTRRTADVRSRGYSNLFVLRKDDLWEALKTYPEAEAILKRKAKSLIQQNKDREASKKKNSIEAPAIIKNDVRRKSTPRLVRTVMQVLMATALSPSEAFRREIEPDPPPPSVPVPGPCQPKLDGSTLLVFHPAPDHFSCPVRSCTAVFSSPSWTSQRRSLERHLEREHNLRVRFCHNFCRFCDERLGVRPTQHSCPAAQDVVQDEPTVFRHACQVCSLTFPSRRGLRNHADAHVRVARRRAMDHRQPPPPDSVGSSPEPQPNPVLDPDPVPVSASVPPVPEPASPPVLDSSCRSTSSWAVQPRRDRPGSMTESPLAPSGMPMIDLRDAPMSPPSPTPASPAPAGPLPASPAPASPLPADSSLSSEGSVLELSGAHEEDQVTQEAGDALPPATDALPRPVDQPATDKFPLEPFLTRFRFILQMTVSRRSWEEFIALMDECTEAAVGICKLPPRNDRPPRPFDPDDAQGVQKLYRRNRRRAIRLLMKDDSPRCAIPKQAVQDHFEAISVPQPCDKSLYVSFSGDRRPLTSARFTTREVLTKLRRCENTAPGDDRLTYKHWLELDPEGQVLSTIFNICLVHKRVPQAWKSSSTVLIYKKGCRDDIKNWRPIAISRTIYKLFTGCLAVRLTEWLSSNRVLCRTQKGFLPFDGVFEHNFVHQVRFDQARFQGGELCAAFIDFSNAFGAIPHEAIFSALDAQKVGDPFLDLVKDLYSGSTTTVLTAEGRTEEIRVMNGIKQGDPLSPLLFNLAVDPVFRAAQGDDEIEHHSLGYADDMDLLDRAPDALQSRIDLVARKSRSISVPINPEKTVTMHMSGKTPVGMRPTQFFVEGVPVRFLQDGEQVKFLGKPVGFQILPSSADVDEYIRFGKAILSTKLAPWQRLDALKTFLFPALSFAQRMGIFPKKEWKRLDEALRPLIKATLYLPVSATSSYLYGASADGCMGIPLAAEDSDLMLIDSAYKLLTSSDEGVRDLAIHELRRVVATRIQLPVATDAHLAAYLSQDTEGVFRRGTDAGTTVWSKARSASGRMSVTWSFTNAVPSLSIGTTTIGPEKRRAVSATLRSHRRSLRLESLVALPSQGVVMSCTTLSKSSSHFTRSGDYTRFADWRFIHRARLNLLPVNANKKEVRPDRRCRRCGYEIESQAHVLNHCMRYSAAYTRRHNDIVDRIKKAAETRFTILSENQVMGDQNLRPDLVLSSRNAAYVIDVTIPYDNRPGAFDEARRLKTEKYQQVARDLEAQFGKVEVVPFVIGSCGSWDPANDGFLRILCSRRYGAMMRKLCVSSVIRWSRDIYATHLSGHTQYILDV